MTLPQMCPPRTSAPADKIAHCGRVPAPEGVRRADGADLFATQAFAFASLTTVFWSVVRVSGVTLFDLSSLVAAIFVLCFAPKCARCGDIVLRPMLDAVALGALGEFFSCFASARPLEHIGKSAILSLTSANMALFIYAVLSRQILSARAILNAMFMSALASASVAVAQGRYLAFRDLIPLDGDGSAEVGDWVRMTGLGEHPIESTVTTGFGIVIALGSRLGAARFAVLPAIGLMSVSTIYTASFTGIGGIAVGVVIVLAYQKRYGAAVALALLAVAFLSFTVAQSPPLAERASLLLSGGMEYETIRSRAAQLAAVIDAIADGSFLLGNGYSVADLPNGMEIHNGLLASVYHFGVLGLAGQCAWLWFVIAPLCDAGRSRLKSVLLGLTIVFLATYLSGPVLARRSDWMPVLLVAAICRLQMGRGRSRRRRDELTAMRW